MKVARALGRRTIMRCSIKRLFSRWHLGNIKVVRRVIVSVIGVTVVLTGVALLVLQVRRMASEIVIGRDSASPRESRA
jgi:hypothetical protein